MSPAIDELKGFHQFIAERLSDGEAALSPEEALDLWRTAHPIPSELQESVAAVREALRDMAAGDEGRPVDDVLAELRARHRLEIR